MVDIFYVAPSVFSSTLADAGFVGRPFWPRQKYLNNNQRNGFGLLLVFTVLMRGVHMNFLKSLGSLVVTCLLMFSDCVGCCFSLE